LSNPSFYILHGEDTFAIAEQVQALKDRLGDPALAALNTIELDGRAVTLADLRGAADAVPFIAPRRLVIVTGLLTRLLGRGGEAEAEADDGEESAPASLREFRDALLAYLPQVPATTALVLIEARPLPERSRFVALAGRSEAGYARRFDPPKGEALARWIARRAQAAGGEFTAEAAQALAAAVGEDTRLLVREIEKLLAYADYARPVELPDVETLTPYAGEVRVFDMVDAMGQRRGAAAVNLLLRLLDQPNQSPLAVFGMVVRQFRLLLGAGELLAEGAAPAQVGPALGLRPFLAAKIADQARLFSGADLEAIYRKLLEMDLGIKSSRIEAGLALETFVADPVGWQLGEPAG
jgi:DNA polymerase-3 subunit delta